MDFFVATRLLEKFANSRMESYENEILSPSGMIHTIQPTFKWFSLGGIVSFIISILIGLFAIYLSWTCNSTMNYNTVLKVIYAFFAYFFGIIYIILYMIMRYDTCTYIESSKNN